MTTIHVQFADGNQTAIVSCFQSPQDPKHWDHLGEVDASDPRWLAYYSALPEYARAFWPAPEGADATAEIAAT